MSERDHLAVTSGDLSSPDELPADNYHPATTTQRAEIIIALVALAMSAFALYLSRNMYLRLDLGGINPRWWPTILSIGAIILSINMLTMAFFSKSYVRDDLEASHRDGWLRMLQALVFSVLYVFAWSNIGYVISTFIYLIVILWVFGLRSGKGLILFPLITTAFIYGMFHYMLRVPL